MDFFYFIFKTAFLQIRRYLEREERKVKQSQAFPEGVQKLSYKYWREEVHPRECNVYKPVCQKGEELPLIIDIHGGCWIHGDKDSYDNFNYDLARKGNVVSSVTYRLLEDGKIGMKEMVQDIFEYLHFLESRSRDLDIQVKDVMLTGDSAGAQLALLCFAINQDEQLQEVFEVRPVRLRFSCLVLTHPVCWIDKAGRLPGSSFISNKISIPGLLRMMYGKEYEDSLIYQYSCNPEFFITEDMDFPPIMIVSSQGDEVFKYQAFLLQKFLNEKGINNTLYYEDDNQAEHVYNVNQPFAYLAEKCNRAIMEFFHQTKAIQ